MIEYYLLIVLVMSIVTFIVYLIDKIKAIKDQYRIREVVLLILSLSLGASGAILGMYLIRHKNRKIKFIIFNWVFFLLQILLGFYLYKNS